MKKGLLITFIAMLLATMPFALGQTEYLQMEANEFSIFGAFGKETQEFVAFPTDLFPGQSFEFCTDYLRTFYDSYDIELMYEFYQDGRFIAFRTLELFPGQSVPADTRIEGCMTMRFGKDLYRPGTIEVRGFIFGNKAQYYGDSAAGILSQVDVRTFILNEELDCSYRRDRCSTDGTGIVESARANTDNTFCIDETIDPCATGECKERFVAGDLRGYCTEPEPEEPQCTPSRKSDGSIKCIQYGDSCSQSGRDSCGNPCSIQTTGKSCSSNGVCQNGACQVSCSTTKIGRTEGCTTFNECGDILKIKPDGVTCEPDPSNPVGGGYACSHGDCIKVEPPKATELTCDPGYIVSGDRCVLEEEEDDPEPPVAPRECIQAGSPKPSDAFCCDSTEYLVNGEPVCGDAPSGYCTDDNSCNPSDECVNNFCKTKAVPEGEMCSLNLEESCSDGSTIVTAFCDPDSAEADEQGLIHTDQSCPVAETKTNEDLGRSGGAGNPYEEERTDAVEDVEEGNFVTVLVFGAFIVLLIGLVLFLLNRERKG